MTTPSTNRTVTTTYAEAPDAPSRTSLLDSLLIADASRTSPDALPAFLDSSTIRDALRNWFGQVPSISNSEEKLQLVRRLNANVARIDDMLSSQLNAVLHQPEFQKLEAAWRGLWYLVDQVPDGANVKVRILNASWRDLVKDQERALEFDQSHLFRKVFSEEFGTPGGEPYGLLIGNYDVCHRPFPDHPTDDMAALRGISAVAAASFAPFVTGVDPRFYELGSFAELEPTIDVAKTFEQLDFLKWRSLREDEDARFLGLIVPKLVLRQPYSDGPGNTHNFPFREETLDRDGYLWGNGAFGFASVAMRAFAESGWLAEIRGVRAGQNRAGVISGLPAIETGTGFGFSTKSVTDVHLTDRQEKEISDLGFIPICHLPDAGEAAFYTVPSIQNPKTYDDPAATANARLSSMLQYMLCVSRIAHYLKVIVRDKVGSFITPSDCEDVLRKWSQQYVVSNDSASYEMKAKYPLREASVSVSEIPGKPGSYRCTMFLRPHFQLDQLSAGIKLTTQLTSRTD